jgi:hypothetical protein
MEMIRRHIGEHGEGVARFHLRQTVARSGGSLRCLLNSVFDCLANDGKRRELTAFPANNEENLSSVLSFTIVHVRVNAAVQTREVQASAGTAGYAACGRPPYSGGAEYFANTSAPVRFFVWFANE